MATTSFSFIPSSAIADNYLINCWGIYNGWQLGNDPKASYNTNVTVANLNGTLVSQNETHGIPAVLPSRIIDLAYGGTTILLPEISGFIAFAILFGISLVASFFSLFFLAKRWKKTSSSLALTAFCLLITSFNIVIFVLKAITIVTKVKSTMCPSRSNIALDYNLPFTSRFDNSLAYEFLTLSVTIVPVFLWVSDAFLVYRTWIIWAHQRKYLALLILALLASIATGIVWIAGIEGDTEDALGPTTKWQEDIIYRWIHWLALSCGISVLVTGMISGRLIHHYRKEKRSGEWPKTLSLATILIESAALSLIAKILQLSIPSLAENPIVVPLCTISSSLIALRATLGANVGQNMTKDAMLPAAHLLRDGSTPGSISAGFERA